MVIARDDCAAAQQALSGMGFQPDLTAVPGLPARLVLVDAADRQVDLHRVVFDGHGNGWQDLGEDAWDAYPAEELTGVGMVAGRQVRYVTPQLQVRHHLGYSLSATDRHDLGGSGDTASETGRAFGRIDTSTTKSLVLRCRGGRGGTP
jgi:hypothetical protein